MTRYLVQADPESGYSIRELPGEPEYLSAYMDRNCDIPDDVYAEWLAATKAFDAVAAKINALWTAAVPFTQAECDDNNRICEAYWSGDSAALSAALSEDGKHG